MTKNKNNPIGVFDSGVGGLTAVKEIMEIMPNEEIIYFGDCARAPYGSKDKSTIFKYAKQIIDFLLTKNVKIILIACNTVSALCYNELVDYYDVPIVEMVQTAASAWGKSGKLDSVGVIGTEATINSQAYPKALKLQNEKVTIHQKACSLFVPLAEEGWFDNKAAHAAVEIYLKDFKKQNMDSLILGCTHYPLLINPIKKIMGDIPIIDPSKAAADRIKLYMEKNNMLRDITDSNIPQPKFYSSGDYNKFSDICSYVLDRKCFPEIINLDK